MQVDPRRIMSAFEYYYAPLKGGYYGRFLGFALRLPDSARNVVEIADNWHKVLLDYLSLVLRRKPVTMHLRDGTVKAATRRSDIAKAVEEFRVKQALLKAKKLFSVDLSFLSHESTFLEVFYYELYRDLDVRGRL